MITQEVAKERLIDRLLEIQIEKSEVLNQKGSQLHEDKRNFGRDNLPQDFGVKVFEYYVKAGDNLNSLSVLMRKGNPKQRSLARLLIAGYRGLRGSLCPLFRYHRVA